MNAARCIALLRRTGTRRVTYAELFFDLVFVFAVTQISHTLLGRFTPIGALQTTLLLLGVWWVWVYTSWVTNWLNPELTPVRILLFCLMLGGLVLSTSIPQAFEIPGIVVRHCLRRDAGRPDRLSAGFDVTGAEFDPHERGPHPGLAFDVSRVLDRGRPGRRKSAARALGRGARHRIYLAGGPVLDPPIRRISGGRLGRRRRAHGGTLRRNSSSSRSVNPSS